MLTIDNLRLAIARLSSGGDAITGQQLKALLDTGGSVAREFYGKASLVVPTAANSFAIDDWDYSLSTTEDISSALYSDATFGTVAGLTVNNASAVLMSYSMSFSDPIPLASFVAGNNSHTFSAQLINSEEGGIANFPITPNILTSDNTGAIIGSHVSATQYVIVNNFVPANFNPFMLYATLNNITPAFNTGVDITFTLKILE